MLLKCWPKSVTPLGNDLGKKRMCEVWGKAYSNSNDEINAVPKRSFKLQFCLDGLGEVNQGTQRAQETWVVSLNNRHQLFSNFDCKWF